MRRGAGILGVLVAVSLACGGCKAQSKQKAPRPEAAQKLAQAFTQAGQPATPEPAGQANQSAERPKITFAQTEYDFGEADQGTKVEHLFTFKNTGNATLVIDKVRSS